MLFDYRIVGPGWAEATLADESNAATITASYLSDALGDLLYAVWRVLEGDAEARCSWEEEPGEYRWIIRHEGDSASLRVLEFPHGYPAKPDELGTVVFETEQAVLVLARAIALGASRCLEANGEYGCSRPWRDMPFPSSALDLIRSRLSSSTPDR